MNALFADLYELTMAQAYDAESMGGTAVFETFFRKLPRGRSYGMAAGLAEVLDHFESLRFDDEAIAYLRSLGTFRDDFLDRLRTLRFTGDVWAVPEGTIVFPNEPIVQVVAPIVEAQLAETFIVNAVHLSTVLASKASRVITAARGRTVVEFGARRAHGVDAALALARTTYLAGASGTSNLHAGKAYGIPVFGTMAHSFVQSFDDELAAFECFARLYRGTTLLVDTYDTLRGVERVIELAERLGEGFDVAAVRLDSGDLGELAKRARSKLDAAGLGRVGIFASSSLDERAIEALLASGAPIDGFGVGTSLSVSEDAPSLDVAYKLVEYEGKPRTKLSSGKVLHPCRKQVYRSVERGSFAGDTLARFDESSPGEPLLVPVMKGGRRLPAGDAVLDESRLVAQAQREGLPDALRSLDAPEAPYPVRISDRLTAELDRLRRAIS